MIVCCDMLAERYRLVKDECTQFVHIDAPCTRSFIDPEHRLDEERLLLTWFPDIDMIGHDAMNKSIAIRRYHWPTPTPEESEGVDPAE